MNKQSITLLSLTFKAFGAVLPRRAIGFDNAQVSVAGQKVMGVSPRATNNGGFSDIDVIGTSVVEAGGAFIRGDSLTVDASGRAVLSTNATDFVFADALEPSGQAGEFVEVLLRR